MKAAIVCCVHGNEKYGLETVKRLKRKAACFVANKEALRMNARFIDADLNRSFPGNPYGNHEERIAFELAAKLSGFDCVIDLHSSSNSCPLFGIITKPDNISLAMKLGLERLVVMPRGFADGKALIDHAKSGISLEIGPHKGKDNAELVE
ncbi:MAG: succinylglutamate desuccinylase/aspartoacylase family protein, partial [Candidatus Woesearchaeota archaeon]